MINRTLARHLLAYARHMSKIFEDCVKKELECNNMRELNASDQNVILYVNIKGLQINLKKLEILVESMIKKT